MGIFVPQCSGINIEVSSSLLMIVVLDYIPYAYTVEFYPIATDYWNHQFSVLLYLPLTSHDGRTHPDHIPLPEPTRDNRDQPLKTTCLLKHLMESLSWDYYQSCNSLNLIQLLLLHLKSSKPARGHTCLCQASTYVVSQEHLIPEVLTALSWEVKITLSPFKIDCGPYQHRAHGYRCKTGVCKLVTSKLETITSLSSHTPQECCLAT